MKKLKTWILLTVAFYLVFLLVTIPADYVLAMVMKHDLLSGRKILTYGVDGSWANGRVQAIKFNGIEFNNLAWCFRPTGLIFGRIELAVDFAVGDGKVAGILSLGRTSSEIRRFNGALPADFLARRFLPGVKLAGALKIEDLGLTLTKGYVSGGEGRLLWQDGEIVAPVVLLAGACEVELSRDDGGLLVKFASRGEQFDSNGLVLLAETGEYSVNGALNVKPGRNNQLSSLFAFLGRPDSSGAIKLESKGHMAPLY